MGRGANRIRLEINGLRILLIHQNFPGQFRQLAPYLQSRGHEVVGICSHQRPLEAGFRILRYQEPKPTSGLGLSQELAHQAFERAPAVAKLCAQLSAEGWQPDCIAAHTGWGETLAIREVWPNVPQVLWPELWVRPIHGGYGVDLALPPPTLEQQLEQLGRNTLTRAAMAQAQAWVLPTRHQANSFPAEFQGDRMHVVHEGINTVLACPNPGVRYEVRGFRINRSVPTITFVNRNLERLRGFDLFMRSLPDVMASHPSVRILVVGDDERGYGKGHPSGRPLREIMLEEMSGQLDLERLHFLGRIPHSQLICILQASWVHVYLSYPFVMGWSLLEAMACGCSIVASQGDPVKEAIQDGLEGLLVPMDRPKLLSQKILSLLRNSELRQSLSMAARKRSLEWDQSNTLPKLESVLIHAASRAQK